ncbi:Oidioi.mRNA.OKI2018_I69.PAR.g11077.t1.cds [Oikopleura dioica]|uniref:Oidioi.mRNA.OKI2018_I69.PAR.g11077.t1.cds n=1 Tax=Oikopleura dioica TaxID=34765 RepID=A0ABN7RTV7_OIKDI|nr:Oidioi.mRNA.OKI2018_I69.PAR.g11077.t1.cds [Oikopleura dioica]
MKLLNSQLDITFENPGKDDALAKFQDSFSSGPVYFEHYIRSPATFTIKAPLPMIFKGINIKASNCILKLDISSEGKVFKNLSTLTFRGSGQNYSLHKSNEKVFKPRWTSQILPTRFSFKFVKLRFRFVKMLAGGVLGLEVLQIFGDRFSANSISMRTLGRQVDWKSEQKCPVEDSISEKPKIRAFFGSYDNEEKKGPPKESDAEEEASTSQSLKFPHRIPISERKLPPWAIDSVTCLQMVHPVLLPSGYWVDRSTLEKWKKESRLWSRPPSDPFTGIELPTFELPVDEARRQQIFDFVHSNSFTFSK